MTHSQAEHIPSPPEIYKQTEGKDCKITLAFGLDRGYHYQGWMIYLEKKDYILDDINDIRATYILIPMMNQDSGDAMFDALRFILSNGPEPQSNI